MGDENSIANETFAHVVSVFESAWAWCVKNDSRFNNEAIYDIVGRMVNAYEREVYKMPENNHNAPITTELRETLARIDAYSKTNIAELVEDKLKAIDSIHANLESEYSDADSRTVNDLKAALKTQRNNFEQATSAREHWKKLYEASQDECKKLAESIKQLESERDEEHDKVNWLHAELKGLEERSIELPKDADGEYIHIGDVMDGVDRYDTLKEVTGEVTTISFDAPLDSDSSASVGIRVWSDNRSWYHTAYLDHHAAVYCHHRPDTWERIEEDARKAMSLYSMPNVVMTLIARCKALAGN